MNLSKLKHLIKPSPNEKMADALTRQIGFFGVAVVEIILNVNFFQSLGESWVMPFAGAVLVFMEVWHWISAQSASGVRRVFHYTAWLAIALTSIVAIVSFGQAITAVASDDVARAVVVQTNQDSVRQSLFETAQRDLASAEAEITDLLADKAELTKYDSRSRAAIDESLRLAEAKKTSATERMERYSGLGVATAPADTGGAISAESVKKYVSARIIFGQIFTDKYADTAITVFFVLFGIAMELTLSLASMPPKIDKKKKRVGLFALVRQFLLTKQAKLEALARSSQAPATAQPLVIMTPQYQAPPAPLQVGEDTPAPVKKRKPKPAPVVEEMGEEEEVEAEISQPEARHYWPQPGPFGTEPPKQDEVELTVGEKLAEQGLSSDMHDYESLAEKKSAVEVQLEEIAKADVEPIVEKAASAPIKAHESETSFLYTPSDVPPKTLDAAEKGGFISNIQSIFNEIKRNGDKELSIKEISDRTNISIVEIRRMFRFFHSRNLLTYDEMAKRWKFKLNKDNIINYLRDKQIQY